MNLTFDRRTAGASFLEVVVAVAIVAFILVPMIVSFTASTRGTDHTNRRLVAISLTNACLERFRAQPFGQLKTLFGPGTDGGRGVLEKDPTIRSELIGAAFFESVREYVLDGAFEEVTPGKLGVLTFRCRFPTRNGGPMATVKLAKVIIDYAKVGWESHRQAPVAGPPSSLNPLTALGGLTSSSGPSSSQSESLGSPSTQGGESGTFPPIE